MLGVDLIHVIKKGPCGLFVARASSADREYHGSDHGDAPVWQTMLPMKTDPPA